MNWSENKRLRKWLKNDARESILSDFLKKVI